MDNKSLIKALDYNIKIAKGYLKGSHTDGFIREIKGYIDGMEWAKILASNSIKKFIHNKEVFGK
jgi:hypothetical protein